MSGAMQSLMRRAATPARGAKSSVLRRAGGKKTCECATCQKGEGTLQRAAVTEQAPDFVPEIVYEVLRSPGQPLDPTTRDFMEAGFQHDFSTVRVHSDERAARSTRAVGADAYTVGNHIAYDRVQFQSGSAEERHLLAHELAHVIQQSTSILGASTLKVDSASSRFEIDADVAAKEVLNGPPPPQRIGVSAHGPVHSMLNPPVSLAQRLIGNATLSTRLQRMLSKKCNSFNYFADDSLIASGFGIIAEKYLEGDYIEKVGCAKSDVYFDKIEGSRAAYTAFIISHGEDLSPVFKKQIEISNPVRPDVLVHGLVREFEELKPNSDDGKKKGRKKISDIEQYMRAYSLPYRQGKTYVPSESVPIASTSAMGTEINFSISFKRAQPGLLLYEICISTDWTKIGEEVLAAIFAVIVGILLKGVRTPVRLPPLGAMAMQRKDRELQKGKVVTG